MKLHRPRTPFWPMTIITTALAAVILCVAVIPPDTRDEQPVLHPAESIAEQVAPTAADPVQTGDDSDVSTVETPVDSTAPSTPQLPNTLNIPSIGFTLPLADLAVNGAGTVSPPDFTHGFVLSDWGAGRSGDPATGSVYVITHSKRDGSGTGNELFNAASRAATTNPGDSIYALGHEWEVARTWHESKEGLPSNGDLWSNQPNTIYLITCLQVGDGVSQSTDNFIVEATLTQ